jgi:hypothetical protein
MLRRLHQLVLVLLSATLVLLPYTEHACNWDKFPTASNDLELQVVCCLCAIGMFLVFAHRSKFALEGFRPACIHEPSSVQGFRESRTQSQPRQSNPLIPLRI